MQLQWFRMTGGRMVRQASDFAWAAVQPAAAPGFWVDIEAAEPGELEAFLGGLHLHPLLLARCLDRAISPRVLVDGGSLLMEYPASFDRQRSEPTYLTIVLQTPCLVTIRHGALPALDELIDEVGSDNAPPLSNPAQLVYQILDCFTDQNVDAQTDARDRILGMSTALAGSPTAVDIEDLAALRWQVGNLISLAENQLYCASSLAALDLQELNEPQRRAYIQDLVSEAEITQRAVYRLEASVNNLYSDYQALGADRVEKRLRLLTIISAITLPLGLLTGLLGMNVGGLPGVDNAAGFAFVIVIMAVIALGLAAYFWRAKWFE